MAEKWDDLEPVPKGEAGNEWEKMQVVSANTNLNRARVAGVGAIEGATNVLNIPSDILKLSGPLTEAQFGLADWLRKQFGAKPIPEEVRKQVVSSNTEAGQVISQALNLKGGVEALGVPTDAAAEAKRLGVTMDPTMKAIVAGTRTAGSVATMGMGAVGTGLSALGAGVGRYAGGQISETAGNIGEIAGGMIAPVVGARILAGRAAKVQSSAIEQSLTDARNAAYDEARKSGVMISGPAMERLATTVASDMAQAPMFGPLHTKAQAAMEAIVSEAKKGPASLEKLDLIRQTVKSGMENATPAESRLIQKMIGQIDDFSATLQVGKDVLSGDPVNGARALFAARSLNTKLAKADIIQTAIDRAGTRPTTFDLAARNEFAALARNKDLMRTFAPDERLAILDLSKGSNFAQALRVLSRFAPTRSGIYAASYGAIGAHEPLVAAAAAVITEGGKRMSIGVAKRNAAMVKEMMMLGYRPPANYLPYLQAVPPAISETLQ